MRGTRRQLISYDDEGDDEDKARAEPLERDPAKPQSNRKRKQFGQGGSDNAPAKEKKREFFL